MVGTPGMDGRISVPTHQIMGMVPNRSRINGPSTLRHEHSVSHDHGLSQRRSVQFSPPVSSPTKTLPIKLSGTKLGQYYLKACYTQAIYNTSIGCGAKA